jgi:8-oxo-dGTP diphosphatase
MKPAKLPVIVVAAIVKRAGKVLLARRKEGSLTGYWEFPGGKIEEGESPEKALRREIFEELSVDSEVGAFFGESEHLSSNGRIRLEFYRCALAGEPLAGEAHTEVAWVEVEDLPSYQVAPADLPIVRLLLEEEKDAV